ncbi:hypothetical protein [Lysinibacillus piscis]|uniref:Uncharacterized protein n=1 Tax=Lysinibacillus piscis TaxID=2518931 RepID=A0ABQ5NKB2_9BACI|nr:hypothetical protein [Lysinibacillus sp. KH24]GLC88796.1 hypothetical protein LYSBPC_19230 [Lysinibacillus sp. KH24]
MEWEMLQKEQERIHTQIRMLHRLNEQKQLVTKQIEHVKQDIDKHRQALKEIQTKLNKLEHFSFMNMVRTWTGQQDELREEKIDQAAVLELKIKEAKKVAHDLTEDSERIDKQLRCIDAQQLQEALKHILSKKQGYLQVHHPTQVAKLEQLMNEELETKQMLKEIKEAEEAGQVALTKLGQVAASLHSASDYSTWDTFFGGGLLATHLKHDSLDQSEIDLHNAQIALQRFHNELLDIQTVTTNALYIEKDGFVKFADYFFDDIFSAWSIHAKISTAREQISRVQDDVHNTLLRLQDKQQKAMDYLVLLQAEQEIIYEG